MFIVHQDPFIEIKVLFVQLITLPFGKLLEWILPKYRISAFGYSCSLNPGPFNLKEHTLISVMVNIIVDGNGIVDIAGTMSNVYGIKWSLGKQFTLGISAQLLGFSFAGILRRFLVWPASMIWPGILVQCVLLNVMHSNYGQKESKHISRQRFLYLACLCSFLWCWLPSYLWTGLSMFSWVCWIAPNNVVINSLFGGVSGLGMSGISFDWAMISQLGSPLAIPVCSVATRENNIQILMTSITVVGAGQLDGRIRDSYVVHLSDYVGYVFVVRLIAFEPLFTLHDS